MKKQRPSHKWTPDETNLFCEILAKPVNNCMETLWRWALKKNSAVKYLIPLLLNLKSVQSKKKSKIFKAKKREARLVVEVEAFPGKTL